MSRLNLSSIGRFFSASSSSRTETSRNDQPRGPGESKPASVGAALSQLSPRASDAPSTSSPANRRPRTELPRAQKKKVSWTPDTPENRSLAALMDNERSTELTRWGMGLERKMKQHENDDPEWQAISEKVGRNIDADEAGLLPPDDSDTDSDSEIRPASRHPAVDVNAMLRQAGLADD